MIEIKGDPLHHPPIPGDTNKSTSMLPLRIIDTGNEPGPYPDGPRDPRLQYPRIINNPRPRGQGCSSCRWNSNCKLLFWHRNFGNIDKEYADFHKMVLDANFGTACESWNIDLEPLPSGVNDPDGLGSGSVEDLEDANFGGYKGQWGFLLMSENNRRDAIFG